MIPNDLKLEVYQTIDAGKHWKSKSNGLPNAFAFDLVLRHGFDKFDNTLMFGSTNGNLYVSENEGEQWELITQNLVKVSVVKLV
jgi:photosystem II stability/assembly factor-like uncharacterized protein